MSYRASWHIETFLDICVYVHIRTRTYWFIYPSHTLWIHCINPSHTWNDRMHLCINPSHLIYHTHSSPTPVYSYTFRPSHTFWIDYIFPPHTLFDHIHLCITPSHISITYTCVLIYRTHLSNTLVYFVCQTHYLSVCLCAHPLESWVKVQSGLLRTNADYQYGSQFIELVFAKKNALVCSNPNMIFMRKICSQRSSTVAGSKHRALKGGEDA